jgi:beta-phosphoglucomutase
MHMNHIKAVILDFNGTLYWDTSYHNEAWDLFLREHQILLTAEAKRHKIHGKLNEDILTGLFERPLTRVEMNRMVREKEQIYREICLRNPQELAPGAPDFLDYLKCSGVPFTIATAAERSNIDFYFETLSLDRWFSIDQIIYNNGSFRGKPDPQIFLMAASLLHTAPEKTVIFEDSFAGIRAAENAGAGKIIIVNSHNVDYREWPYQVIRDFREVDRKLFEKD